MFPTSNQKRQNISPIKIEILSAAPGEKRYIPGEGSSLQLELTLAFIFGFVCGLFFNIVFPRVYVASPSPLSPKPFT